MKGSPYETRAWRFVRRVLDAECALRGVVIWRLLGEYVTRYTLDEGDSARVQVARLAKAMRKGT